MALTYTAEKQLEWEEFKKNGGTIKFEIDPADISTNTDFETFPNIEQKLYTGFELPPYNLDSYHRTPNTNTHTGLTLESNFLQRLFGWRKSHLQKNLQQQIRSSMHHPQKIKPSYIAIKNNTHATPSLTGCNCIRNCIRPVYRHHDRHIKINPLDAFATGLIFAKIKPSEGLTLSSKSISPSLLEPGLYSDTKSKNTYDFIITPLQYL